LYAEVLLTSDRNDSRGQTVKWTRRPRFASAEWTSYSAAAPPLPGRNGIGQRSLCQAGSKPERCGTQSIGAAENISIEEVFEDGYVDARSEMARSAATPLCTVSIALIWSIVIE
jgi:hypothetical protein